MSTLARKFPFAVSSVRAGVRQQRLARVGFPRRAAARGYASETTQEAGGNHTKAITGGIAGGLLVFLGGYGWYYFSGAKTAVNSVYQASQYMTQAKNKMQAAAPEPNEALAWLRQTAQSYAGFIPGAKGYVDKAFDDLDAIHKKHGGEVDSIVSDTYEKLKEITDKKGVSMGSAVEGWTVIEDGLKRIMSLAGDAAGDILNNHPKLKEHVGGDIDQLKSMGERYGPQAKEQVDKTWEQIQSVVSKGVGVGTLDEIRKIVKEKMDMLKNMGDDVFEKGLEEAKPYLDKSPKAKELVEQNKDALKQGDMGALWEKVKEAASSGNTENLESFIKSSADKVKQGGEGGSGISSQLPSYLKMIPGADEIASKLQKLQEIGQKHGKEAEDLLKSTMDEVKELLKKKEQEAENLAEKAKENS